MSISATHDYTCMFNLKLVLYTFIEHRKFMLKQHSEHIYKQYNSYITSAIVLAFLDTIFVIK